MRLAARSDKYISSQTVSLHLKCNIGLLSLIDKGTTRIVMVSEASVTDTVATMSTL